MSHNQEGAGRVPGRYPHPHCIRTHTYTHIQENRRQREKRETQGHTNLAIGSSNTLSVVFIPEYIKKVVKLVLAVVQPQHFVHYHFKFK